MKSKVFKTVPFYSTNKIRRYILDLFKNNIDKYNNDEHINIILYEINRYIDEPITINDTDIYINKYDNNSNNNFTNISKVTTDPYLTKVIICIKQPKRGGYLIVTNKKTNYRKTICLNSSFIILLTSLASYSITDISKGKLITISFNIIIPSLRIINIDICNDIKYSSNIINLIPVLKDEYIFIIKQLSHEPNKLIICEQILINKDYYTIISSDDNNQHFYISSICFGSYFLDFNYKYSRFNKEIINIIINNKLPFELIYPIKITFDNKQVYEKVIYGKIYFKK
ncbi:hypothetical protein [Brazilian porcupinepox virus 1]|nr:hypothetical protein [Brazilian porcupinepox virus 1]